MTRKKAIEAAVDTGLELYVAFNPMYEISDVIKLTASRAYDLGRIAGLKEAASLIRHASFLEVLPDVKVNQQAQRLEAKLK